MLIPRPSPNFQSMRTRWLPRALCLVTIAATPSIQAQRMEVATRSVQALARITAVDTGQLPISEPLTLTLRLQPSAAQTLALDHLLSAQIDPASPSYHRWLSPQQYAEQFGATDDQIAALTRYLGEHGLAVTAVSPARTRLTVTGNAGQAQLAFRTSLHRFSISSAPFFANAAAPTLPPDVAALVAGISGLDNLPEPASARISPGPPSLPSTSAAARLAPGPSLSPTSAAAHEADSITAVAAAIDANASPILTLTTAACSSDFPATDVAAYRALFRQASAQGITVLAASSCQNAGTPTSFPAELAGVTALATSARETSTGSSGTEPRPAWQAAPGLPADDLRHEPDLTTTSTSAFAQAIANLNAQTGNRLGNINATLYALAKTPGLFTQPDTSPNSPTPAGSWQPATGLGLINLDTLFKVYPRGNAATTIDFQSSTYSVSYGTPFTLRANINSTSSATAAPTGTVTFTASSQGVLGSSAVTTDRPPSTPAFSPSEPTPSSPPTRATRTTRPAPNPASPSPSRSSTLAWMRRSLHPSPFPMVRPPRPPSPSPSPTPPPRPAETSTPRSRA